MFCFCQFNCVLFDFSSVIWIPSSFLDKLYCNSPSNHYSMDLIVIVFCSLKTNKYKKMCSVFAHFRFFSCFLCRFNYCVLFNLSSFICFSISFLDGFCGLREFELEFHQFHRESINHVLGFFHASFQFLLLLCGFLAHSWWLSRFHSVWRESSLNSIIFLEKT